MTDHCKQTHDVAKKIAQHLEGWRYDETRGHGEGRSLWPTAFIVCQDEDSPFEGFRIAIGRVWNSPKLEICLSCDPGDNKLYLKIKNPKMGCSAEKAPERIAMDIERRLYPQMIPAVAELRKARQDALDYQNGKDRTRAEMLKSPHVETHGAHDPDTLKATTIASDYGNDIKICSDGTVTLTVSEISPAQAREILALLNKKGA